MCMYVTNAPNASGIAYLIHPGHVNADRPAGIHHLTTNTRNSTTGMNTGTNDRNGIYADGATHVSDYQVGFDTQSGQPDSEIFIDQSFAIGSMSSGYVATPAEGVFVREIVKSGMRNDNHFFGYASCHWLRSANPGEMPGSPCSASGRHAPASSITYHGYIFTSDTGSLECGRLSGMDNEYGEKPLVMDKVEYPSIDPGPTSSVSPTVLPSSPGTPSQVFRCPAGSPARGSGTYVSTRLLIAGCMITNDTQYDILADVHLPAACSVTQDLTPGCMHPGALNYDPAANQVGPCRFPTSGCMSMTAVNYNSEATVDDGSCITRITGCTVPNVSYNAGGLPTTPGYKSNSFGSNVRTQTWSPYDHSVVNNYNPQANAMAGGNSPCEITIEGCMDPTAVNYDPAANINTNTWCVPVSVGCMMPNDLARGVVVAKESGLSSSWEIGYTRHDKLACQRSVIRYGCSTQGTMNYDPAATVASTDKYLRCYSRTSGCLNPQAQNFGCEARGISPCTSSGVTVHDARLCTYNNENSAGAPAPPAPSPAPLPPVPEGMVYQEREESGVEVSTLIVGAISFLQAHKCTIVDAVKTAMGDAIDYTCDEGSYTDPTTGTIFNRRRLNDGYVLTLRKVYGSPAEAAAALATITTQPTIAAITSALPAGIASQVTIASEPTTGVRVETVYVAVRPSSEEDSTGAIVGGVVGGLAGVALIGGAIYWYRGRSSGKSTTVVPA